MAHVIMDRVVSWCFGTSLAPLSRSSFLGSCGGTREAEQPPPRDKQAYLPPTLIMAGACLGCNWQ